MCLDKSPNCIFGGRIHLKFVECVRGPLNHFHFFNQKKCPLFFSQREAFDPGRTEESLLISHLVVLVVGVMSHLVESGDSAICHFYFIIKLKIFVKASKNIRRLSFGSGPGTIETGCQLVICFLMRLAVEYDSAGDLMVW
jgi:hypothetical protein